MTMVDMQIAEEEALEPVAQVFLDRALPDALACYGFLGLSPGADYLSLIKPGRYNTDGMTPSGRKTLRLPGTAASNQ
jgi:predicted ATPase